MEISYKNNELNIINLLETGKNVTFSRGGGHVTAVIDGKSYTKPSKDFNTIESLEKIAGIQLDDDTKENLLLAIEGTVAKSKPYQKCFSFYGKTLVTWADIPPLGRVHHLQGKFVTKNGRTKLDKINIHLRSDVGVRTLGNKGTEIYDVLIDDMAMLSECGDLTPDGAIDKLKDRGYVYADLYLKV